MVAIIKRYRRVSMFFKSLSHHFTLCPYFTICEVLKILNKLHTVAQSTTHSPHSAVILEDVKIYIVSSLQTRKVEQAPSSKSASKSIKVWWQQEHEVCPAICVRHCLQCNVTESKKSPHLLATTGCLLHTFIAHHS